MSDEVTTSVPASLAQTYYEKAALDRLIPNLTLQKLGMKLTVPKNSGKIQQVYRYTKLQGSAATSTLSEATAPSNTAVTATTSSLTLVQMGAWAKVSDFIMLTHRTNIMDQLTNLFADQMSEAIDLYIRNTLLAITASGVQQYGTALDKTSATITTAETFGGATLRNIAKNFKVNNVRPFRDGDAYVVVVSPYQAYSLMAETASGGIMDTVKYAQPKQILRGELGKLAGVRVVESSLMRLATSTELTSSVTGDIAIALGDNAFVVSELDGNAMQLIVKQPGSGGAAGDPLNMIGSVGFKVNGFGALYIGDDGPRMQKVFTSR